MNTIDKWVGKKMTVTLDKLEAFLWKSADILRGSIDSSEYKHFIFGFLFPHRGTIASWGWYRRPRQLPVLCTETLTLEKYQKGIIRWEIIGFAIERAFLGLKVENWIPILVIYLYTNSIFLTVEVENTFGIIKSCPNRPEKCTNAQNHSWKWGI